MSPFCTDDDDDDNDDENEEDEDYPSSDNEIIDNDVVDIGDADSINSHTSDSHTNKTTTELTERIPRKLTHQQEKKNDTDNNDTEDEEKNSRPEIKEALTSNTPINIQTSFDSETTQPQTKATHNTTETMELQQNKQDEPSANPEDTFD